METENTKKTYNKPREMFDDACLLLACKMEEYGFKYSKSQAKIKKKDKLFTYNISFYSSHFNYISEEEGHVVMEFFCTIMYKNDIIFRLSQKELRSETYRFEIFDNETKNIDLKQIEKSNEFIKTYFLPVVHSVQTDVNSFLENMVNQPVARFDVYGFKYEPKFLEVFDREDLLEKYESKIEEFNSNQAINNRTRFKKYITSCFENKDWEQFDVDDLWTTLQKCWTTIDSTKFNKLYYDDYNLLFEDLAKIDISDRADWLIDYYILICACKDYIEDDKLKEKAISICNKFLEDH